MVSIILRRSLVHTDVEKHCHSAEKCGYDYICKVERCML